MQMNSYIAPLQGMYVSSFIIKNMACQNASIYKE